MCPRVWDWISFQLRTDVQIYLNSKFGGVGFNSDLGGSCSLVLSHVRFFVTPWTVAYQASLSFTISWSLLKFTSMESAMPSNHLILCRPLLLLPSFFPSIRVFSSELALCIWCPKYWSSSISPSSVYPGLISFRVD